MEFLNPLFLWTLLGLSIPIAIHLWSKKKVRTIKIGSTQFLRELNPKQTKSIRLNQWFLLLVRLMIITLLALILAVPRIEFLKTEKSITYLVEPSLIGLEKVNTMLDTIADGQVRLLETDFPLLEDLDTVTDKLAAPNYWQLAHQMKTLEADSIIVLTKGLLTGFKGMRPSLNLPIHWLQIDPDEPFVTTVEAALNNDELVVNSIKSDPFSLSYINETFTLDNDDIIVDSEEDSVSIKLKDKVVKLPLIKREVQRVLIVSNKQLLAERIYISASFKALSTYLDQEIEVSSVKGIQETDLSSFDVLIWLKQEAVISFEGKTLLWEPDDLAIDLIEQGASKDQYVLRQHLDAENSLDLNLTSQLMVLLDFHEQLPDHLKKLDQRAISLQEIQVNKLNLGPSNDPKLLKDMSFWLWALLLLLLPVERILSKYKKQ